MYGKSIKSPMNLRLIESILEKTKGIEGDVIELGVYRGGTTVAIAKKLKDLNSNKMLYSLDTFEGYPEITDYDKKYMSGEWDNKELYKKGRFSDTDYTKIENVLSKKGLDNVGLIKGRFSDSFLALVNKRFCFAFLDCDLALSYKQSLDFLIPRMNIGGIIYMQNYFPKNKERPANKVIELFFKKEKLNMMDFGVYWIKTKGEI